MADLDGLMKQSKELINLAYDKGFKEGYNALKEELYDKIKQVENEPTGARYWVSTQELRDILKR